jgi:hypothetical protein
MLPDSFGYLGPAKPAPGLLCMLRAYLPSCTPLPSPLQHDIRPLADIPVRKCSLVRYSPGGHAFAAVGRNNAIIIYPGHPGCITGPTAGGDREGWGAQGGGGRSFLAHSRLLIPVGCSCRQVV